MSVKLIAHVLLCLENEFLIIQRSEIKRGEPNVYAGFWDIPGGGVEEDELPRDAAVRECLEETGIEINQEDLSILHEDSQLDFEKETVFTRLVYACQLVEKPQEIILDPEEHVAYSWVPLSEQTDQNLVPYLQELIEKRRKK
ncbi:NUDIX hydrolase [Streptococcus cameli]